MNAPFRGVFFCQLISLLQMYLPGFILLFASWMQPLHVLPWVSWHSEILTFLAAVGLVWQIVFTLVRRTSTSVVSLPVAGKFLLWLGVVVGVQWACGLIPFYGDVFVDWAYLLLCVACMFVGYYSSDAQPGMIVGMAATVLAGALVAAIVSLVQAFELSGGFGWILSMPSTRRPGANLGQPNQLATLVLMGLASLVFLLESKKIGVTAAPLMALLLITSLAATESRAGVLGFLFLNLWWFSKRKSMATLLKPWAVMLVGLAFWAIYRYWTMWMAELFQLPGGALPPNTVAYNRWIIWPQLVEAALLRPWFGWGVGQISAAHNAVVDRYSVSEAYTYAHNILLDSALGFGLPLSLLMLLLTVIWLWNRIRACKDIVSWYCLALALPVAVHSLVEFPFAYAYFLAPVMFAIGVLDRHLGIPPMYKLGIKWLRGGLLIGTLLVVWSSLEYLAIEEDFRIVRFEALNVGQTPLDYEKPKVYLFSQLDALLYGGRMVPRPGMPVQEIELSRMVALRYPWPATQNRYALTLALNGNSIEAVRQLRVMRAQHGIKAYTKIKATWVTLAHEKYPQLNAVELP